jgi:GAF domain-containing protein
MTSSADIGRSLAAAARTMNQDLGLDETLQVIAEAARNSVPGFDQVGISTVDSRGGVHTRAAAGDLVHKLDQIQYGLGEGPCVDSLRHASMVTAPTLRHDQRWPRYVPAAVAVGVRSQLAVKLYLDDGGTLGGLNFYSTITDDIDPEAEQAADLFATHAAIALGNAHTREGLNDALQSRKIIGQAIGILMERYEIDEDRAFAFLVRASSQANIKLRVIAQELVDQQNDQDRRPATTM